MTPQAKLRMLTFQEGQRAHLQGTPCPYTAPGDWRAGTWEKGRAAAKAHYESLTRHAVEYPEDKKERAAADWRRATTEERLELLLARVEELEQQLES